MTKDKVALLHAYVTKAAKALDGKLPDHPAHPYGRIPIAHIYDVIKRVMGCPAKDCRNERYDDLIKIVDFCRDFPDEPHCASALRVSIQPEPVYKQVTLEDLWN
jgi:hypothetical protein